MGEAQAVGLRVQSCIWESSPLVLASDPLPSWGRGAGCPGCPTLLTRSAESKTFLGVTTSHMTVTPESIQE